MRKIIILLGGLAVLAATYLNRNDQPAETTASQEARTEDTSLFDGQIKAIDKARGVEDTVMSAYQKRDAQMDAQGQ